MKRENVIKSRNRLLYSFISLMLMYRLSDWTFSMIAQGAENRIIFGTYILYLVFGGGCVSNMMAACNYVRGQDSISAESASTQALYLWYFVALISNLAWLYRLFF